MADVTIRAAVLDDAGSIGAIYDEAIMAGNATFAVGPHPESERRGWLAGRAATAPVFVADIGDTVVGWSALAPFSHRSWFSGVAEYTVYVATSARGAGIGAALLADLVPDIRVHSLTRLATRSDHVVFEVNGDLILRVCREEAGDAHTASPEREAALLDVIGEVSPLPVPVPLAADTDWGAIVYRKLPGTPLSELPAHDPRAAARSLASLIDALHHAPSHLLAGLAEVDEYPMDAWRADARRDYDAVADRLPRTARARVEGFLAAPPPPASEVAVFCHNDLGAEHVLVDESGAITGVIDWSDAALADPARDVARILRDLGPGVFQAVLAQHPAAWDPAARERAVFYARCALLEDLVYGLNTGTRRYADAALAHLPWTFATA